MIKTRIRKCIAMFLTLSITAGLFSGTNFILKASAASGTLTFNAPDSTNVGQRVSDGQYCNDIPGIQLDIYNASTTSDANNGITSGSLVYLSNDNDIHGTYGGIAPIDLTTGGMMSNTPNADTPKYMVIKSSDNTAFSLQSIYVNDYIGSENKLQFEGFLNGAPTGSVTRSIDETTNTYDTTLDFSNEKALQNVDEVRISNLMVWDDGKTHGNWAAFNNIAIGEPVSYTINPISDQTMSDLTVGYSSGSQETKNITIKKSGTADLNSLSVALDSAGSNYFTMTQPAATTLDSSTGSTNFTVKAKDSLAPGTYTGTVTVAATNMTPVKFKVTQVVDRITGSISITVDPSKTYDGSAVTDPAVTQNGTGLVTYTYYNDNGGSIGTVLGGAPVNAGIYWVKASMAQDANYSAAEATKQFTIRGINMTGSVAIQGSAMTGATVSANASGLTAGATYGYVWRLDGTPISGQSGSSYTISESDYGKTLTVALVANGNYSGSIASSGETVGETIAPTGSITVAANHWTSFLDTITFGLFFKDTQNVAITAADAGGSGVKSIQYYKSATALSLSDVQTLTGWNDYSTVIPLMPTDAEKLIIYAKITDNAGNVSYLNSNGMAFDTQGPSITANYTKGASSMDATVTDSGSGVQSVSYTVNGGSAQTATLDASGKFTIPSLAEGRYDIAINATDKAGNTNSITVHVVSLYTVTFKLYSGDTGAALKTQTVEYGNSATPPDDPTRTGFSFKSWDKSLTNIKADTTVNATWDISGVTVIPYSGTYDGTAKTAATVSDTLPGDTVTYSTDGTVYTASCPQYTNAGSYPVYVRVARAGCTTWESGLKTAVISNISGSINITGDPSKTYDGSAVTDPAVTQNGTGLVTYTYYTDNSGSIGTALSGAPSAVGTYWVKASMAQDANYSAAVATKQFTIRGINMTGSVAIQGSAMTGATVSANASGLTAGATYGYVWRLDGTPISGQSGSSYTINESDYGKTLTVALVANGNYSGSVTSSGVTVGENIAPTGSITVAANHWTSFLNTITFGLFFKDTQNVAITAADAGGSGVKSIQYYKSATALSLSDVQALTGWSNYSSALSLTPADTEKFIIYAKITDNAGNVSYLNSNGMTFDTQGPSITTNYTKNASSMDVTVADSGSGIQSVSYTVNSGSAQTATLDANGKFTIPSLAEGKYDVVITAADHLGNERSLTVHVVSLYTVTFKLYSGDTGAPLKTQTVEYGSSATAPSDPTRTGFAFGGWDRSCSNITADTTVNATWGIGGVTVTLFNGTYDGTAKTAATVSGTLPGDTVTYSTNGTDYTASCPQYTNAGSYPVYVRVARAGYTTWESGRKTAVINKKPITANMISDIPSAEYTGTAITPRPAVTYGAIILQNGSDYSVSYTKNTDVGLACVNVTGSSNYTGVASKEFAIYAKETAVENEDQQTPPVLVDGLQNLYQDKSVYTAEDRQIEQNGGSVKMVLSVQAAKDTSIDKAKIEKLASDKTIGLYLDLTLAKTVTLAGEQSGTTTAISHVNNLLTVVVPIPDDIKGKQGIALYRVHQGVASIIPIGQSNAVDGEYCTIDASNITLYVRNFSTYAIGFKNSNPSHHSQRATPNPDTGDNNPIIPLSCLPFVITGGSALVIWRKKKHA